VISASKTTAHNPNKFIMGSDSGKNVEKPVL